MTYTYELEGLSRVLDSRGIGIYMSHIIRAESAWKGKGLSSEGYKKLMAEHLRIRLDGCLRKIERGDKKTFSIENIERIAKTLGLLSFEYRYLEFEGYYLKRALYEYYTKKGIYNGSFKEVGDSILEVTIKEAPYKDIYEQYGILVEKIRSLLKKR